MMRMPVILALRLLMVLALFAATAALGFGHRVNAHEPALQAYLDAGGALDDLCNGGPGGDAAGDCPACTLAHGAVLPAPGPEAPLAVAKVPSDVPAAAPIARHRFDHSHPGRAPPVL